LLQRRIKSIDQTLSRGKIILGDSYPQIRDVDGRTARALRSGSLGVSRLAFGENTTSLAFDFLSIPDAYPALCYVLIGLANEPPEVLVIDRLDEMPLHQNVLLLRLIVPQIEGRSPLSIKGVAKLNGQLRH